MKRTPLTRRTPLRPMSRKRRKQLPARRACLAAVRERSDGRCEFPGCTRAGVDGHEILTRARGGSPLDAGNVVWLCRAHHDFAHDNPAAATRLGLLVSQHGREA